MQKILDHGHLYELLTLDGEEPQTLRFVKRMDAEDPSRFPGNTSAYSGTTVQSVVQCLLERIHYLQGQISCDENTSIIWHLREVLVLLELRAIKRHGFPAGWLMSGENLETAKLCSVCGHSVCMHGTLVREKGA